MKFLIFLTIHFISHSIIAQGFLRVDGINIVNDNNSNYILKGIGLGGWLVQEGYMLQTPMSAEHEIKEEIQNLIGSAKTEDLYEIYHDNYVRKIDIDSLASWGFNSIRLPMHYNKLIDDIYLKTYNEKGFERIDSLLSWCEANEMYLILDLHAAPGGQSDEPISDYGGFPSLWESEVYKKMTVDLWKEIAERYANEEWIGGYDLINEPKWELGEENEELRELYVLITDSIRTVDTNHIIFIEGNWFATAFNGLTPPWDDNMVYSFHKYWNETDQGTIGYLVDIRSTYKRPLWLGETGENSNDWFRECVNLMDENNIGWAWWPHKKIDNISGPLSVPKVDGYQKILDYWNGTGGKPSETYAFDVLKNQFEALKFENCKVQRDVYNALFNSNPQNSTPYRRHTIPGIVFGTDYDSGGQLIGYKDNDYKNTGSSSYNNGWNYRNDGVDIEICSDSKTNGFNIGWIETGEYLKYTVEIEESGNYDFEFRFASTSNSGKFMVDVNEANAIPMTDIPLTGGWQNWQSLNLQNIPLDAGISKFNVRFFFGGFNFNYFNVTSSVTNVGDISSIPQEYNLSQNYPNPFNPATKIEYSISETSDINISVYNSLGQKVLSTAKSNVVTGSYEYDLVLEGYSSGIYYCKLDAKSIEGSKHYNKVIKIILLK